MAAKAFISIFIYFLKSHFLVVCLPKLLLFGNLGFMVLIRELVALNPYTHEKGNMEEAISRAQCIN